jgi:hypothetical protein
MQPASLAGAFRGRLIQRNIGAASLRVAKDDESTRGIGMLDFVVQRRLPERNIRSYSWQRMTIRDIVRAGTRGHSSLHLSADR